MFVVSSVELVAVIELVPVKFPELALLKVSGTFDKAPKKVFSANGKAFFILRFITTSYY
jgi:hypothetical protein